MVAGNQRGVQVFRWMVAMIVGVAAIGATWEMCPAEDAAAPASQAATAPAGPSAADLLTDAEVVGSISRGLDFLIKDVDARLKPIQAAPASKRGDPGIFGNAGELMLEAYALLHVGADVKDSRLQVQVPRMKLLEDVMTRLDTNSNYITSLQTLALAQMPRTAEVKKAMAACVKKLVNGRTKAGGYGYVLAKGAAIHDQSNSQYALLAVWAAADWGAAVPPSYWKETDDFWRAIQLPNGGWGYGGVADDQALNDHSTASMTTAGIASLFVCDEFLHRMPRLVPREDPAIDQGLAAMLRDFDPTGPNFYYLYGLERVGLATGLKFFGRVDWYREIAANLLRRQMPSGAFKGDFPGSDDVSNTCYAIMLLARGRAPVLMNKLQYDGFWNTRPRDSANVHADLARRLERHLNWQSVPLDVSAQQWLDAPILYITGSKDPKFTSDDVEKLRQFVVAGGMIFSSPDGDAPEFNDAMKKYAREMLGGTGASGPDAPFRALPPDHPLFSVDGKLKDTPKLLGVSNGLRELWIHSQTDYGAIWQSRDKSDEEAWNLPMMLFSYAAGKGELRSKLQPLSVRPPAKPPSRHTTVALLRYDGNWNPEPGAWPRLAKLMANNANTDVTIKEVAAADLAKMSPLPALAHLGGLGKLVLTDQERASLKAYVAGGGTLFVEAYGGDDLFAKSSKAAIKMLFPEDPIKLVPADYTLYTGGFSRDALAIHEVSYRRFWWREHGQQTDPRLEYMTVNKRVGVFFSGEDITCGLLGTNTWGIGGYTPSSAEAIARNLVLYATRNAPRPHAAVKAAPAAVRKIPGAAAAAK